MTLEILTLLLIFQAKHLIADYYLQFPYMYKNKGKEEGWFIPLFNHSLVHASMTFIIIFIYFLVPGNLHKTGTNYAVFLTFALPLFDLITHFVTDRWKATRKGGPDTSEFWRNLGIDQYIHHVVGIIIIWGLTQ